MTRVSVDVTEKNAGILNHNLDECSLVFNSDENLWVITTRGWDVSVISGQDNIIIYAFYAWESLVPMESLVRSKSKRWKQ